MIKYCRSWIAYKVCGETCAKFGIVTEPSCRMGKEILYYTFQCNIRDSYSYTVDDISPSLIGRYEFVTSGHCNAGWLPPNVETDSVINCLEICNIRENANHFSWNPSNKACSCYDTDPCSPDPSAYSMNFKSFKMIDNGMYYQSIKIFWWSNID